MAIEALSFIILEDGTRAKKAGEEVFEGQPVKLDATGTLAAATAAVKVYGISKLDSNVFRDFAFGEFGAFGSGNLTVVTRGVMTVGQSIFNEVEVDTQTTIAAGPTTVKVFDDTKTYVVGETLYVDAAGLISNDSAGGKESLLGKVLKTPPQLGGTLLEIEIDPGATADSADLA